MKVCDILNYFLSGVIFNDSERINYLSSLTISKVYVHLITCKLYIIEPILW
jgi:hypothetical protein